MSASRMIRFSLFAQSLLYPREVHISQKTEDKLLYIINNMLLQQIRDTRPNFPPSVNPSFSKLGLP